MKGNGEPVKEKNDKLKELLNGKKIISINIELHNNCKERNGILLLSSNSDELYFDKLVEFRGHLINFIEMPKIDLFNFNK